MIETLFDVTNNETIMGIILALAAAPALVVIINLIMMQCGDKDKAPDRKLRAMGAGWWVISLLLTATGVEYDVSIAVWSGLVLLGFMICTSSLLFGHLIMLGTQWTLESFRSKPAKVKTYTKVEEVESGTPETKVETSADTESVTDAKPLTKEELEEAFAK